MYSDNWRAMDGVRRSIRCNGEGSDVHMNQNRVLRPLVGLIALFLAATVLAQQPKNLDEAMSYDGLQKINIKGIDMAYALPGATLSGYRR